MTQVFLRNQFVSFSDVQQRQSLYNDSCLQLVTQMESYEYDGRRTGSTAGKQHSHIYENFKPLTFSFSAAAAAAALAIDRLLLL